VRLGGSLREYTGDAIEKSDRRAGVATAATALADAECPRLVTAPDVVSGDMKDGVRLPLSSVRWGVESPLARVVDEDEQARSRRAPEVPLLEVRRLGELLLALLVGLTPPGARSKDSRREDTEAAIHE